jgi:hypothetical protein
MSRIKMLIIFERDEYDTKLFHLHKIDGGIS